MLILRLGPKDGLFSDERLRMTRCPRSWGSHRGRTAVTFVTVFMCITLWACGGDPTIWSATSQSPNGYWLAVAHTVQHTGPGYNGVETIVEIRRSADSPKHSQRVLAFSNDGASMELKMNWVSPSHLEVVYKDDPEMHEHEDMLYYQVIKTSGIDISVRKLSSRSSSSK